MFVYFPKFAHESLYISYNSPKQLIFTFFRDEFGRLGGGFGSILGDVLEVWGTCLGGFWEDCERCLDSFR